MPQTIDKTLLLSPLKQVLQIIQKTFMNPKTLRALPR